MRKQWKEVEDKNVRLIWKKSCKCDTKDVAVPPTFFGASGIPICQECGEDMEYVKTEIATVT